MIKINLAKFDHVIEDRKTKSGGVVKVITLPIESNDLFLSEKGNCYLDLIEFQLKKPTDDQTHIIKQSLPKAVREKMTQEQMNEKPIIGSAKLYLGGSFEDKPAEQNQDFAPPAESTDDLPF